MNALDVVSNTWHFDALLAQHARKAFPSEMVECRLCGAEVSEDDCEKFVDETFEVPQTVFVCPECNVHGRFCTVD